MKQKGDPDNKHKRQKNTFREYYLRKPYFLTGKIGEMDENIFLVKKKKTKKTRKMSHQI